MLSTSSAVTAYTRPDGATIMRPAFAWDGAREQAAMEIAEGCWRTSEIADHAGVSSAAISVWIKEPEFRARVDEHIAEIRERVVTLGISRVEIRIGAANERWLLMQRLMRERGEEAYLVPGGSTGLLTREEKQLGGGATAQIVEVFKVDIGLLKELRELEMAVAKQLGQLTEKVEFTGAETSKTLEAIALANLMTTEQLEALRERAQALLAGGSIPVQSEQVAEVQA